MNEGFQEDLGLQEQAVEDEMRAAASTRDPDLSQTYDIGDPALTAPTVAPAQANPNQPEPIRTDPDGLSDEQLTQFAIRHIRSLGGDVQFPAPTEPPNPRTPEPHPAQKALVARRFDQLAQSVATEVAAEAGAEGAAKGVYDFITQLGPDAVPAYQTNALFRDMVDTKIDAIVGGHARSLEERDKLPMLASEEVGGSTEKELRAGLSGHRQAFERAGLGEHMSFDDFIRDLEL